MSVRARLRHGGAPAAAPGEPGRIELERSGRRVDVTVDGIPYSTFHPDRPWSGYAWDALAAAAVLCDQPAPSVLLLGAGAGTVLVLLRRILPGASLMAVELDPRMIELGRERGGLDASGAEIVVGDALAFLAGTRRTFDVILDDLFAPCASGLRRPVADEAAHLGVIARRLRPGGVAATNSTTDGDPPGLERAIAAAHREVFRHRVRLAPPRGYNAIHAGSAAPLRPARLREAAARLPAEDARGLSAVRPRRT